MVEHYRSYTLRWLGKLTTLLSVLEYTIRRKIVKCEIVNSLAETPVKCNSVLLLAMLVMGARTIRPSSSVLTLPSPMGLREKDEIICGNTGPLELKRKHT